MRAGRAALSTEQQASGALLKRRAPSVQRCARACTHARPADGTPPPPPGPPGEYIRYKNFYPQLINIMIAGHEVRRRGGGGAVAHLRVRLVQPQPRL